MNATRHTAAVAKSGLRNGPLPAFPAATPEGDAFWKGYALAPTAPAGTAPVPSRLFPAFEAGRRRKHVEPGINNATDPRRHTAPLGRTKF